MHILKKKSIDIVFDYLLDYTFKDLYLGNSSINGQGIHTNQDITKGEIICPLFGIVYPMNKAKVQYPLYSYQISDIHSIECENEPGFFNHSCNPNVYLNEDRLFVAIHDIKIQEEITIDYNTMDYSEYGFACGCGESQCRKDFNGLFAQNKEYQQKMGQYFDPYLKNKFNLNP